MATHWREVHHGLQREEECRQSASEGVPKDVDAGDSVLDGARGEPVDHQAMGPCTRHYQLVTKGCEPEGPFQHVHGKCG